MLAEWDDGTMRRAVIHAALADPGRLAIVDELLLADASPSELQGLVSMSSNLMAHHLGVLEQAGMVCRVRSEGDRRRTYLQLIPEALEVMVPCAMRRRADRVVFVCSQNSARSQLAVAVWKRRSALPAASAGTHPAAIGSSGCGCRGSASAPTDTPTQAAPPRRCRLPRGPGGRGMRQRSRRTARQPASHPLVGSRPGARR